MTSRSRRRVRHSAGRQISLKLLLPALLALLVLFAVLPVIAISYLFATDTAERLLSERAESIVDGLESQIQGQLGPVEEQLMFARRAIMDGSIDPEDPDALRTFALGLLAGTPQLFGVGHVRPDLTMRRWERESLAEVDEPADRLPFAGEAMEAARDGRIAYWAQPFFSIALGDTILNYRVAVERDGELLGVLAAAVTSEDLSHYVAETSDQFRVTAFVLAGRDRVITYPGRRALQVAGTSTALPLLSGVADPVIARIWDDPRPVTQTDELTRSTGHWSRIDGVPYAYYYRELADYGPEPLIVGVAIPSADTRRDRWAATIAAGVGLVLMVLTVLLAWRLGRVLSRPTADFDTALDAIAKLQFTNVALPRLTNSRVREWRATARRLEDTAGALSAFQTYLPRALVRRLFDAPENTVESQERTITVMFLDLEGFTAYSRGRGAGEVASYLNEVFGIVGPIIEAHGGVIDKYTGDGILAFWGAPDAQPDHAARACRAAAEIAHTMRRHLAQAVRDAPRLRIGLHCGPAIVGNIGFPGRIDYTLVGDTVNVAERTEAALRGIAPEDRVVVAVTQSVLEKTDVASTGLTKTDQRIKSPVPAFVCEPSSEMGSERIAADDEPSQSVEP